MSALQIIWLILIVVLWIGYVTLEGFGFGTGMLLKILPKNAKERRLALNTIGPHWDGNEVFLLTAGGATFAAFPGWYATMFSGMYMALVAVLLLLIIRIVAIEWRGKINSDRWRNTWDTMHTTVAWLAALVWGVAFGNLVQGMDIQVGGYLEHGGGEFIAAEPAEAGAVQDALSLGAGHYLTGGFISLFTPFTIVAGLVVVSLFLNHGALWLSIKTKGDFQARGMQLAKKTSLLATGLTAVWALWAQFAYSTNMYSWIPLALAAVALIVSTLFVYQGKDLAAFFTFFGGMAFAVVFIFVSFMPYALKSTTEAYSLTLVQASATAPTHKVMLIAAIIFVPIVLAYTAWAYKQFSARLGTENISDKPAGLDPKKIRAFASATHA